MIGSIITMIPILSMICSSKLQDAENKNIFDGADGAGRCLTADRASDGVFGAVIRPYVAARRVRH
jgi:hypothetical protein